MIKWTIGMVILSILALALPGAAAAQGPVECEQIYVVQRGDTLAHIAGQFYDNPWAYPAIVFATNRAASAGDGFQTIADPNLIEVGWTLCVPEDATDVGAVDVRTFKNLAYLSEFTQKGTAPLANGEYSEPAAPGSATKTVIKLHERMAFGYTAGGQPFAAVVLVTDPGGSGTFYELVVLTFEGGKPQHVASALLGDRVRIQSLAIESGGEIVVRMIAHGPDDPMCCPTQHAVARYALQGEALVEAKEISTDAGSALAGTVWEWERFVGGDDSVIEVEDPSRYTLVLNADGTYQVVADCNRAGGAYTLEGSSLVLQPGPATLAECGQGSLYDDLLSRLGYVRTYVRDDEGRLVLNLFADAGNMFFRRASPVTMQVSLEGTSWKLISYLDGKGVLASVLEETEVTAAFADGQLTGSAGCNNYFASYRLAGKALSFGPAGATRRMCAAPQGIMEQEYAYLAALGSAAGYRIQGERLEWLDAKGTVIATFEAVQGASR